MWYEAVGFVGETQACPTPMYQLNAFRLHDSDTEERILYLHRCSPEIASIVAGKCYVWLLDFQLILQV